MANPFKKLLARFSPSEDDRRFHDTLEGRTSYGVDNDYWYYPVHEKTLTGIDLDEYNALEYTDVYKCVRVIAETIAMLPLLFYKRAKNNGGKERAEEHPLFNLLHLRPNSEMTKLQFWETAMGHILTWGNHYSQIEINQMGDIINLWPLRPDRIEVVRGEDSLLAYEYRPTDGGPKITFSSDEILHIPGLGFNGVTGYSPIAMAREAMGLGKAAEEFASRFFGNDATPPMVIKHPQQLKPEARDNLKKSWKEAHGGLKNAGKPAILEEGMTIEKIGIPMREAQFLELRKFQRSEICGIYRVPPHMISDTEPVTSWGTGIEQQTIGFIMFTIMPWLVRIEQAVNFKLLSEKEQKKYFCEHLIQGLLRGDSAARASYYRELFYIGVFSQNDILRLENMNPIGPKGDKRYVPNNLMPLGEEINPPVAPAKPPENEPIPQKIEQKEEKSQKIEVKLTDIPNQSISTVIDSNSIQNTIDTLSSSGGTIIIPPEIHTISSTIELSKRYKDPEPSPKIETEKVHTGFKRIWEDAISRVVRRESIAIHRAIKRQDMDSFESYMDGFYRELPEFVGSALHPSVTSYAEMVGSTGAVNCISSYTENHIKDSRNEISKWAGLYLFSTTSDNGMRANEKAIDDCIDCWSMKRPEQGSQFIGEFFTT